jgi:excisionase family DNA binding protein
MTIENSPVGAKAAGHCVKLAVSIREAAVMLSISPRSVQNYIRMKMLPARKIGRRTVIPVRALEAFLRTDHESPTFSIESGVRP